MSFLFRPISRLFRVGKSRHLAGTDLEGNRYYEYPSLHGSDDPRHTRRLIEYRVKKDHYSEYDTKNVAVQWKMWLRHTRMDPPPLDELEADKQRMLRLQENVRLIAIRDEESRRAAEVKRLEEYGEAVSSFQEQKQQQQNPSGPRNEQASPPSLGETPDQGQAQTEAADRAVSSAEQTLHDLGSSPSSSTAASTAAAAPVAPRPRPRTRTSAVPTSQVQDEGIPQQQRARRVPISVTRPRDANSDEAQGGSHLAGQISEVREADNDVWKASRDRIRRQDNAAEVDSSGGRRSYSTSAAEPSKSRQGDARNILASMRPGLGARLPMGTIRVRRFSTGPVRPPSSHSSRPTPSPRPFPPTPQSLPPRTTPQAAAAAPAGPDVPRFVYIVGGGVIALGLAVIWILPGEFTTLTTDKLNHTRSSSGAPASSIKADRWSTLPILRSLYAVSPSNLEELGDGQHKLISLSIGPSAPEREGVNEVGRRPLSISSISIAQPHIQIERSYTPLQSPEQADFEGKLDLLVKRYADGEMGRYLHGLTVGEGVEVRGWIKSWDETWMKSLADAKNGLDEIVLIVGGTGIAPAYQLISSILKSPSASGSELNATLEAAASPTIKLLYASARPSSFLLLPELQALQQSNPDHLDVTLFSEEGLGNGDVWSSIKGRLGVRASGQVGGLPALQGRIQLADLQKGLPTSSASTGQGRGDERGRAILVIGTEGMVQSMAGRRGMTREGRVTQGKLGGLLREVSGVQEEEVWKL